MTDQPVRLGERLDAAPPLPGPAGWYAIRLDGDLQAWARFASDESCRWVIDCLVIQSSRISSDDLRAIPVGHIERLLNVGAVQAGPEGSIALVEPPLTRRRGEDAKEFAKRVARQYQRYARISQSPAREIAKASDVPVRTVHGWIREARRLGELPAGRQGKVG